MTDPLSARRLRQLLFVLVVVLTFEGLARKASPMGIRVPLFFLKDILVLSMVPFVLRMPMPSMMKPFWRAYMLLAVLMLPPILATAWHDPLLAVYGAKQYLLYPIVGFATFLAFENSSVESILGFFRWLSLLLIPTTIMALVQSRLPADHWLNMSVSGENMRGFSAGGELRVSSTFSFVAQYCAFLNAEIFIILLALHGWSKQKLLWKIVVPLLIPALVLGSFITGSRSAVVGNICTVLLAAVLVSMKFRIRNVLQIGFTIAFLYGMVLVVNHYSPHSTAAYAARENGQLIGFSSEIRGRVFDAYFNFARDKTMQTLLGNGLGVMSNGSDTFSSYAAVWRNHFWTETDLATTLFEGGYYLVLVWYGFRIYIILMTLGHFLSDITPDFFVTVAFCEAFVIIVGTLGTLALQPPIAIWWWLGVGTLMLFCWKCIEPPEAIEKRNEVEPSPPRRKVRGRSLYADVIHPRK
jgi:hypothetical protein